MLLTYQYNTYKKEGDFIVLDYEQIKFNIKYNILPDYKKNIYFDIVINKELDYFFRNFTGKIVNNELKKHGSDCDFMIKFTYGGTYHYNEDTYLNDCFLVHDEDDAKAVLYTLIKRAILELQLSKWERIKQIFSKK